MCISPASLLSALLLRIEREGYQPAPDDLAGLVRSGCKPAQIRQALAPRQGPGFERALALLDALERAD